MKKIIILLGIILSASCLFAQSDIMTVYFTGVDRNNAHVKLDKVLISNQTKNWQDTIYYPDTVYRWKQVGIDNYEDQLSFALTQNVPNPFAGTTDFSLQMPTAGKVHFDVIDFNGREIATYSNELSAGKHVLRVQLTTPQTYILNARCGKNHASIKMLNTGNAGINRIQYLGEGQNLSAFKQKKDILDIPEHPSFCGDEMRYIGYTKVDGIEYQSELIRTGLETASQKITLHFPFPIEGLPCYKNETITDYDSNTYNTVQIGTQCWMKENLKTAHYNDGTDVVLYYYPNDNSITISKYGYLYPWGAVTDNICPKGWHVPSDAEWSTLTDYVRSQSKYQCGSNSTYIAKALAATTGWDICHDNCAVGNLPGNNNATGFSGEPAGSSNGNRFYNFGKKALYWSSTEDSSSTTNVHIRSIHFDSEDLDDSALGDKSSAFSIRCIMDKDDEWNQMAFLPSVTTYLPSNIKATTANCGGYVSANDVTTITARGVCWSSSPNPTISDNHTTDGHLSGDFTSCLTNLMPFTSYYIRAYVTSGDKTVYGSSVRFTTAVSNDCTGLTVTDYDGNEYNTIQIGGQCWMKENLRTTHYSNGTNIPLGDSLSLTEPYRYYPYTDSTEVSKRGYLYNWKAAMDKDSSSESLPSGIQGICPTGWHLPSDAEWKRLYYFVKTQSIYLCGDIQHSDLIAKSLADTTGWISYDTECTVGNNQEENNSTGFTAIPSNKDPKDYGREAAFWSTTVKNEHEVFKDHVYIPTVFYFENRWKDVNTCNKMAFLSVRCLRDDE